MNHNDRGLLVAVAALSTASRPAPLTLEQIIMRNAVRELAAAGASVAPPAPVVVASVAAPPAARPVLFSCRFAKGDTVADHVHRGPVIKRSGVSSGKMQRTSQSRAYFSAG